KQTTQNANITVGACGVISLSGSVPVTWGNWFHTAVTYDGTTLSMYFNGILSVQQSTSLNTTTKQLVFGKRADGVSGDGLSGLLAEVRIWNFSMTPTQILNNFNSIYPYSTGLVGWWNMRNVLESTVVDDSDSGNDGILYGDVSLVTNGSAIPPSGYALKF